MRVILIEYYSPKMACLKISLIRVIGSNLVSNKKIWPMNAGD